MSLAGTAACEVSALFARLAAEGLAATGKIFHSQGLKVGTRFVAFLHRDGMGIKLPPSRVTMLVGSGQALPFIGSRNRTMKGWAIVRLHAGADLEALVREAVAAEKRSANL